jgi:hypothetical protein
MLPSRTELARAPKSLHPRQARYARRLLLHVCSGQLVIETPISTPLRVHIGFRVRIPPFLQLADTLEKSFLRCHVVLFPQVSLKFFFTFSKVSGVVHDPRSICNL